jgi:uncharacterized protein (TIGR02687 family)
MTDERQLTDALSRVFVEEGARIVFWNDPDQEFLGFMDRLPFLMLGDVAVNVIRLDRAGALEVKLRLERDDPNSRYLLYSPAEEPEYENDWLLDVRLYSRSFRADRPSILLDELGLKNHHLREHLTERRKFFDNKERLQKLKQLVADEDSATDLDLKMIAVLVKADQPELFNILRTLYHALTEERDHIDLDTPTPAWVQLEKFDLAEALWQMVNKIFGYGEDNPTLKNFLIRLLVTDYAYNLKVEIPTALVHLVLPSMGRSNAVVFLAQWRDSHTKGNSYDLLSEEIASLIHIDDVLQGLEISDLLGSMTFLAVEKRIASSLRERVLHTAETIDLDEIKAIATHRQAGHWASATVTGDVNVNRKALHAVYSGIVAGAEFFALRKQYQNGFDFADAALMYQAYEEKLYRFDQLYRHFCENADAAEAQGWNILKPLRETIEDCYINWYLRSLATDWGKFIDPQGKTALLNAWRLNNIPQQTQFFEQNVRSRLDEAENRRAYVIISDAFRYEAAKELAQQLNGKYRFEATISSQLGVLPSYTSLGMASLLPHDTLRYKNNADVLVDDKPTASTEQRNEILQNVGGMVCKSEDLLAMRQLEGRELVKGKRVVYVYHGTVDAIGDKLATEDKTFTAVRMAIDELASLVTYIINNLNGNYIVITADHGFLFTESKPGEPDKSKLTDKPAGTVIANKRYLLGHKLPDDEAFWHGKTSITASCEGDMEFLIPRGTNRFHFVGGSRFLHGGAMLQEIVVPVITVKHVKGKSAEDTKTKPVTVHVLGASHKITTSRHRFELIQVEPVSERVKSVTLKVAVYDKEEPVTNVESVTFESGSDRMDGWKKWVHLVLQERQYNKKTPYRLVLRDATTGIEQESVPVIIDRAFTDDF